VAKQMWMCPVCESIYHNEEFANDCELTHGDFKTFKVYNVKYASGFDYEEPYEGYRNIPKEICVNLTGGYSATYILKIEEK
jgi:hypothetical protein